MQVVVNQLLTSYSLIGSGKKAILFLHGWADTSNSFETLSKEVIKKNKDYQAILLDLPGFGGTEQPPTAWGLEDYANFAHEFLKKVNIKPEVIIGHSNGGAIAIHGLAHKKLQSDKLVLIASAGIRDPASIRKATLQLLAQPAKLALKTMPVKTQRNIKQKLYSAIGSDYMIAEHMRETFKKVVATDVREDAKKITIPVCLIYGDNDTSTPVHYGHVFARLIPQSSLHIIPMTGHHVHQEQVYKVTNIINEFIKS